MGGNACKSYLNSVLYPSLHEQAASTLPEKTLAPLSPTLCGRSTYNNC
jgi:hypothetical protein